MKEVGRWAGAYEGNWKHGVPGLGQCLPYTAWSLRLGRAEPVLLESLITDTFLGHLVH